jgi:hypothetical protein
MSVIELDDGGQVEVAFPHSAMDQSLFVPFAFKLAMMTGM